VTSGGTRYDVSTRSGSRLQAMLRGLCPRCRQGRIFRGQLAMHEACPVCGLRFGREAGYYTEWALAGAGVVFLLFVPAVFRYSRVVWIHFDRWIEPDD
jgi:uncharacterized protein (DUF983 family)